MRLVKNRFLVIGQLPPPVQGTTVMAQLFVHSLKNLKYDVRIEQKKFSIKQKSVGKITFAKLLLIPDFVFRVLLRVFKFRPKFCVVFVSVLPPTIYLDLFILWILNIIGIHTIIYLHGKGYKKVSNEVKIYKKILRHVFSRCTAGFVLGNLLKDDVNDFIDDNRLHVLPNAIMNQNTLLEIKKNDKNDKVKILFLSNFRKSKGALEFLKMANNIIRERKNVHFFMAGSTRSVSFMNNMEEFVRDRKLNNYVTFTGPVYGKHKEKLFHECDIFVFPSYYPIETFGLVNLEAMQMGLPIVSSGEGAIPEVVQDGINGYIVNPLIIEELSNAVIKLIDDPVLRKKMGLNGKKIFKNNFTIQAYEKRLKHIINCIDNGYN